MRFAFWDESVEVSVPEDNMVQKIDVKPAPPLPEVYEATLNAMRSPVGTVPIKESVRAGSRVLVAVPDKSRHTDIRPVVKAVLDEVTSAGVRVEDVTIIIALGTHRAMTSDEIADKVGDVSARDYRVVNHDYDDIACLVDLGKTSDGLPVEFNKLVTEHDYIISIGNISAHPVAGYSGGAKGLLPGISGKRSTDYLHWESTRYHLFEVFGNPDNPVRAEMERIVGEVGLDFIVNTTENADREVTGVFAGHFVEAHREGLAFLRQTPLIAFPTEQPDVLVVGMGIDRPDLWGGAAGIYAASALLKEGGTLILFAACPEGVAPEHPVVLDYGYPNWEKVRELVEKGEITDRTGASHVVTIGKVLAEKKMDVVLVSRGICESDAERMGFHHFDDHQRAFDEAMWVAGAGARVLAYERI